MNFTRTYQEYEEGFGGPEGEFWIGKNTQKPVLYFTGQIMLGQLIMHAMLGAM